MTLRTYTGACLCRRVRFEIALGPQPLSASQGCNCVICSRLRSGSVLVKPHDFRLFSGEQDLTDYQFGTRGISHMFCRHCGVRAFGRGTMAENGGAYVSVSMERLDVGTYGTPAASCRDAGMVGKRPAQRVQKRRRSESVAKTTTAGQTVSVPPRNLIVLAGYAEGGT